MVVSPVPIRIFSQAADVNRADWAYAGTAIVITGLSALDEVRVRHELHVFFFALIIAAAGLFMTAFLDIGLADVAFARAINIAGGVGTASLLVVIVELPAILRITQRGVTCSEVVVATVLSSGIAGVLTINIVPSFRKIALTSITISVIGATGSLCYTTPVLVCLHCARVAGTMGIVVV